MARIGKGSWLAGLVLTLQACSGGGGASSNNTPPPEGATPPPTSTPPAPAPLVIAPTSLPNGQLGAAYSAVLSASGGTGALSWSVSSGALPSGLAIDNATGA